MTGTYGEFFSAMRGEVVDGNVNLFSVFETKKRLSNEFVIKRVWVIEVVLVAVGSFVVVFRQNLSID